jgi:hypothetical protein
MFGIVLGELAHFAIVLCEVEVFAEVGILLVLVVAHDEIKVQKVYKPSFTCAILLKST